MHFPARIGAWMIRALWAAGANTAPAHFLRTCRSKSLLGRARQPLGVRNHWPGVLLSHSELEIDCSIRLLFSSIWRWAIKLRNEGTAKRKSTESTKIGPAALHL